ncbi:hypothetical protein BH10PLA2_BH10PLA2_39110 [soil metagenome]
MSSVRAKERYVVSAPYMIIRSQGKQDNCGVERAVHSRRETGHRVAHLIGCFFAKSV